MIDQTRERFLRRADKLKWHAAYFNMTSYLHTPLSDEDPRQVLII